MVTLPYNIILCYMVYTYIFLVLPLAQRRRALGTVCVYILATLPQTQTGLRADLMPPISRKMLGPKRLSRIYNFFFLLPEAVFSTFPHTLSISKGYCMVTVSLIDWEKK